MITPKHPKRPADFNQRAFQIVQEAVGEPPAAPVPIESEMTKKPQERQKNPAAVELGKRGGRKGGLMRAMRLTAEERSDAAKKAAFARWKKQKPQ